MTIATILLRIVWNQNGFDLTERIQLTDHYDIDRFILTELTVILLLIIILPLNYGVYSYAIQLQAHEMARKTLTQKRQQFVQFV